MSGGIASSRSLGPAVAVAGSSCSAEAQVMDDKTVQRKVVIGNPQGFHLRPQGAFAQLARQFQSTVSVVRDDRRANGKSGLELMLMSVPQGTELVVEANGPDAQQAVDALAELLSSAAVYDDDESTSVPPKG